jgi:cytoskeletal protein CcmA (bactofilin family)
MRHDKKDKNFDPSANQNRINEGTHITGDIDSKGFFRIDGTIKGNVTTPNKIVIGKKGLIDGTLTCDNAEIEGTLTGKLHVKELLSLKSTAIINGEVKVGKLSVEPGATFNATCAMGNTLSAVKAS